MNYYNNIKGMYVLLLFHYFDTYTIVNHSRFGQPSQMLYLKLFFL